jgi:serine/threonine protein kinase
MSVAPRSPKDLFLAALEKATPAERAAFLDGACAGDAALRRRVEALLQAYDEPDSFPVPSHAAEPADTGGIPPGRWLDQAALAPAPLEGPGTHIGPYKLLQKLGEGGMGTVYLAEQEQPVKRRVALKIIKAGLDSAHVLARFEAERQALALMDHPHIAKVLDAGTTAGGHPYFVMELVKGLPITKYCDQEHLTLQERLALFIPVCQAVQHAHQKGIIHRDLKPSNVLIALYDGKAVPKVIDFGVAKATGQKLTERTMFTAVGQLVGTLEYMAPEQAELNNLDIDTRADIYSLGVLLYELLTGSPPFTGKQLRSAAFTEMLRLIREVEPPRPSTRLSSSEELPNLAARRKLEPKRLTRLVQGDLDWIVMKCLEKDRGRRYETANALAMDMQRYLADEPVLAGPPGTVYRLRKFVKRHKGRVAAAGMGVALLVLGAAASTWQAVRATQAETRARAAAAAETEQRERAEDNERQAKEVLAFFQDKVLAAGRPEGQEGGLGKDVTLRRAVDAAEPGIAAAFRAQPLVEASIRDVLGKTYIYLGESALAIQHAQRARALRLAQLGPEHPDTLSSMHNLATAYSVYGKLDEALPLYEEVFKLRKARLGPEHPDTLSSMFRLAWTTYHATGKRNQALAMLEETLQLRRARLGPEHPDTLTSMHILAWVYMKQGRLDQALPLSEESFKLHKAKLGPEHPDTLNSMDTLASVYQADGNLARALPLYEETVKLMKGKLGPEHPVTLSGMAGLAGAYLEAGRLDEALSLYEETLKLYKAKQEPDHPTTLAIQGRLALTYVEARKLETALPMLEEVGRLMKIKYGQEHPTTLLYMVHLARAYDVARKYSEAALLCQEALAIQRRQMPVDELALTGPLSTLGLIRLHAGRLGEAEPLLREHLAISQKKQPDNWKTFDAQSMLGGALLGQQKYAEAEPMLLAGYEGMRQRATKIPATGKVRRTEALERLVQLYDAWGKPDEAAKWRKQLEETKAAAKPQPKP